MIEQSLACLRRCLRPRRGLLRFARDRRGVSAVEFAIILPLMITTYFGSVELLQGLAVDRKVTLTARTIADLVSQSNSIDNTAMANIFEASGAVMIPYPEGPLTVTVTAVDIDNDGKATVAWSESQGKTPAAYAKGASVTVPASLIVKNTQLIWSEVTYDFKPSVAYKITGTLKLKDQLYMRPRLTEKVTRV
jgi:Flp pilus assembly protein TadG